MKTKTLGWIVVLGATVCSFASCSQAKVECQVLLAGAGYAYATQYVLKGSPSAECLPYVQKGDLIGMEFYNPASADGRTYDTSKVSLGVQADWLGNELTARGPATNTTGKPWALGSFTSHLPDEKTSICSVPTLAVAEQHFGDVKAMKGVGGAGGGAMPPMSEVPEDDVSYQWKNIQVYTTAAAQGTQFTADLTFKEKVTKFDPMTMAPTVVADCTFEYKVIGMGPGIPCTKVDAKGNAVLDAGGKQQSDASLCSPCTDVDAGRTIASGINPDFPTVCTAILGDPDAYGRPAFYCMLKDTTANATIPQLGSAPVCPSDSFM